jgi:hypothetical protein
MTWIMSLLGLAGVLIVGVLLVAGRREALEYAEQREELRRRRQRDVEAFCVLIKDSRGTAPVPDAIVELDSSDLSFDQWCQLVEAAANKPVMRAWLEKRRDEAFMFRAPMSFG